MVHEMSNSKVIKGGQNVRCLKIFFIFTAGLPERKNLLDSELEGLFNLHWRDFFISIHNLYIEKCLHTNSFCFLTQELENIDVSDVYHGKHNQCKVGTA